jgi:TolA-binding protein
MFNRFFLVVGLFSVTNTGIFAQESTPLLRSQDLVKQAKRLIDDEQFSLSRQLMADYLKDNTYHLDKESYKRVKLLEAYCALKANENNGKALVEKYIENNPEDTDKNILFFELANREFQERNWNTALHYINACDPSFISRKNQDKFYLYKAYSLYKENKLTEALDALSYLKNSDTYRNEADYYKGLIYFKQQEWQLALQEFGKTKKVLPNNRWAKLYAYSLYNLKRFPEVIQFIDRQKGLNTENKRALKVVRGLSHHHLNKHDLVIADLEGTKITPSEPEASYALAYAYYQKGKNNSAIAEAIKVKKDMASVDFQNAQFLLGKIYIEQNKKQNAIACLENVLEVNHQPEVREIAHYEIIKLSYEINSSLLNTEELIYSFMEDYPSSIFSDELFGILVQSFIKNKEYEKGIHLLETKKSNNIRTRKMYQEICLYRGVQYYNQQDYGKAKEFFEKSLSEKIDSKHTAKASFWLAESLLKLKMPQQAIRYYRDFMSLYDKRSDIEENKFATYHLGYAYFDAKDYYKAIDAWKKFITIKGIEKEQRIDAHLRLGDAYMLTRNYTDAKKNFRIAANHTGNQADYATYLEAICENILDNKNAVIQILINFDKSYPNSVYNDDARFQLGETYFKMQNYRKANSVFKGFIENYPSSSLVPQAQLRIARMQYNDKLYDTALQGYKEIVEKHPNTKYSDQAIAAIKNIYYARGEAENYINYINGLEFYKADGEELDAYTYNSAFKLFKDAKFKEAIKSFRYYLGKYPSGYYRNEANFYLATALTQNDDLAQAETSYEKLITNNNEFKDESLHKLAKLNYNKKDFAKALNYYTQLAENAQHDVYKKEGQLGIIRTSFKLGQLEKTMTASSEILKRTDISSKEKEEVKYILGVAALNNGSLSIAKKYINPFANLTSFEHYVEANYYLLEIDFKEGKFDKVITDFGTDKKRQILKKSDKYLGKSMLLYAKAHVEVKEKDAAKQILQLLLKRTDHAETRQQATDLLNSLQN